MKTGQNICYQLARILEKNEWRQFVRDAQQQRHKGTRLLISILAPHYPGFDISDEAILAHPNFIPGQTLDQLRVLRSNVRELLEEFLLDSHLKHTPQLRERMLIAELTRRRGFALAAGQLDKTQRKLPDLPLQLEDLDHARMLEDARVDLYTRTQGRGSTLNWATLLRKNNLYAHTKRLQYLAAWKARSFFQQAGESRVEHEIEVALAEVERFGPEQNPLLQIYFHLLAMMSGKSPVANGEALQAVLRRHGQGMEKVERINVLGLEINVLLQADLKGGPGALRQAFEVYRYMVKEDLLFGFGVFSVNSIRNILSLGVRLHELEWTLSFLEIARERLPAAEARQFYPYGKAYICFARHDYPGVRKALRNATHDDPFYAVAHRVLALRTSYMEGDSVLFSTEMASLARQAYREKKIASSYNRHLLRFLHALKKLERLREEAQASASELEALREDVRSQVMPHRAWLLEQVEVLKAGRR